MKTVIFASLLSGAAAFSTTSKKVSTTALRAESPYKSELGAVAPLGYFDPIGFGASLTPERFEQVRFVELKHGRVAMLAVVGYLTTYAGIRFPGAEDVPAGFAALGAIPSMVWVQMIATWAMMEAANRDRTGQEGINPAYKGSEFKGDFRNGLLDFGWDKQSDKWKTAKRTTELNQGRAAMMGITGLMVHDAMGNVASILP